MGTKVCSSNLGHIALYMCVLHSYPLSWRRIYVATGLRIVCTMLCFTAMCIIDRRFKKVIHLFISFTRNYLLYQSENLVVSTIGYQLAKQIVYVFQQVSQFPQSRHRLGYSSNFMAKWKLSELVNAIAAPR